MTEAEFKTALSPYAQADYSAQGGALGIEAGNILSELVELSQAQLNTLNNWWEHIEPVNWLDLLKWIVLKIIEFFEELFD